MTISSANIFDGIRINACSNFQTDDMLRKFLQVYPETIIGKTVENYVPMESPNIYTLNIQILINIAISKANSFDSVTML